MKMTCSLQLQILVFLVTFAKNYVSCQIDVIDDFQTNPDDIFEGTDIAITCQASNEFNPDTDNLNIFRTINDVYMPLAFHFGIDGSVPENIEFAGFTNNTLRLTISNIQISDSGDYTCAANRSTGMITTIGIGRRDLPITVQDSYPPVGQIQCSIESEHSNFSLKFGEMLQLTCLSTPGSPQVELQWSSTGNIVIPKTATFSAHQIPSILSPLTLETDRSLDGISFTCSRQSQLFPSSDDSCVLGPFTVPRLIMTTMSISQPSPSESNQTVIITVTVIIIIVLITIFSVILLFLWISKRTEITCHKSKDSCPGTTSDDGDTVGERVYETRISDKRSLHSSQSNKQQVDHQDDLNVDSNIDDQYTDLNRTDVSNTTYMELKRSTHSTNPNVSDELPKYANVNLTKTDTVAEDQYMGLNKRDSEDTAYTGLIKGNRDENIQLSSENQGETENSGYENADFNNEASDYVNVECADH